MRKLTILLIIGVWLNLTEGPQESQKPIYEQPRMNGMNGK